ncbi:MAG: hypothetical protein ACERKO_10375 [Acetanaerobacterium sp.]
MSLLSAVSAWAGSGELAAFWTAAKTVLLSYIIPAIGSLGIIRIIQIVAHNIKAVLNVADETGAVSAPVTVKHKGGL